MMKENMEAKIITLVGMSGVGKSYWSEKLKNEGYTIFSIDNLISVELQKVVDKTKGDEKVSYGDTQVGSLAKWMGFPGDKRYEKNCKIYLKLEEKITKQSLKNAKRSGKNCVIDTTGSVIYLSSELISSLKKDSKIFYLDISKSKLGEMFKTFCKFPKPIIWGNLYKSKKDENENQTLKRCYKNLLDFRIKKYRKISHKTIAYNVHKKMKDIKIFYK